MPAAGALPDRGPPASPEIVHTSERTRIVRLALAGRKVVRKQPLGPDAQERVHHELGMLRLLRGVRGVVQLVDTAQDQEPILMEDAGRLTLSELEKPLPVDDLTGLAVQLAHAVAGMHGRGVLHHDIAPANVVLSPSGAPSLVDFALATASAELRPEFTHPSEIVGTLPYLAPEQTGRTGRPVDQRADLYALGATLYELATGAPPFGAGDPLRLMHDHLARVPAAPAESNPAVPAPLSDIVMHLLEKEPDERYQSAEGLLYDLEQLRAAPGRRGPAPVRVGEHDVRPRLLAPARLVARDDEVAALREGFEQALLGHCRAVLVAGAAGVGKTALVDELRSAVTGVDGWFVAGKFDQYRRDLESDGIYQAFRALGRLLLAEPEAQLGEVRERILRALGPGAAEATAVIPEFKALLGVPPEPGDPLTAQVRAQRNAVQLIRAIASRKRPVVVFLDDLQWAGRTPLGFVDLVLSEEVVEDLMLVAAYREGDVDAAHPLAAVLSRSRDEPEVRRLRLRNLPVPSVVTMVAEMLQVDGGAVAGLVDLIAPQTSGNPYETVELLNGLRRDGLLTLTAAGWRWDDAAVRAHVGRSEAAGLPAARLDALAPAARRLAEEMACLGGRAELNLLQVATAEPASVVERLLAPILDEGLLVLEPGAHPAVRFRHDRIRETILGGLGPARRRAVHLELARQLAAVPELFAVAAEQYLPVVDAIGDPAERRQVVGLLRRAADQAALIGDYRLLNALMEAALGLVDPDDVATLVELHTARHSALYGMARLEEADEEYRAVEALSTTSLQRADATAVQVSSLTHRNRFHEAVGLGIDSLRELGVTVPAADRLPLELDHQFDYLHRWLVHTDDGAELARSEITEPKLLAATRLVNAMLPAAYPADLSLYAWLSLEAFRIWLDHGPGRTLVGPASIAAFAAVALRGDYAAGYRAMRRILALGEARGYEPDTSHARFEFALLACWFEPIENGVHAVQRAREGLIAGGELTYAGYTYQTAVQYLLDCAPSLDVYVAEVEAGMAFARRTGSEQTGQWLDSHRWLADVLRGESTAAAGEAVPTDRYADDPLALCFAHIDHATAAAIFGDAVGLTRHTAAAMPLLSAVPGNYPTAVAHLLRGLALAGTARATDGDERGDLLAELDEVTRWLAARAADAPDNFLHLLRLIEAERAWAVDDFRAAAYGFDAARREVAQRQRPWHRALIAERAARFYLAHGLEHAGHDLLAEARQDYFAWGATAKVDQLDWAFPPLRTHPDATFEQPADRRSTVTTGTIDLLGILSASQALSSETSVERLHGRVVDVLGAMTGATGVDLALWSDERLQWMIPAPGRGGGRAPIGVAGDAPAVPMSVLRYVQRTGEPLIVDDAAGDDRFARDPYFTAAAVCSLLAVPILSRGALRAVLLLENRLVRGAFTTERLESVKLVAGQLAVSLDNAQLYAEWRRIADEQAALQRVATLVAQGSSPTAVFDAVAGEIERLLEADGVALARYEPGERAVVVAHRGAHESKAPSGTRVSHAGSQDGVAELGRTLGMRASTGAPIVVDGRPWGIAIAAWPRDEAAPPDAEERMGQFARLLETAIANADSRDQLTASRARLLTEADAARRRVVRDLHDGAQQRLVHTVITLDLARQAVREGDEHAEALVAEAVEYAHQANRGLRELAHGILPADLASTGLRGAVASMVERLDLPVTVDIGPERLPAEIEANAYFIVAEALTNIVKHAGAGSAAVTATVEDGELRLEVRDDGVGGADPGGHGLIGIEDRATALGGRFTVHSPPGGGTVLTVALPVSRRPTEIP